MKKTILFLPVLLILLLASCNKDFDTKPINPPSNSMSDLVISPEFNWKTTKDINVKLKSSSNQNHVVYIKSLEGDIYQKALLKSNVIYYTKITIPTYVTEVKLTFDGSTVKVPITDGAITYSFD